MAVRKMMKVPDIESVSAAWRTGVTGANVMQLHTGYVFEWQIIEMYGPNWGVNLLYVVCVMSKEQGRGWAKCM